jgi:glycosyltransferase involved in cell wall biosynthesis
MPVNDADPVRVLHLRDSHEVGGPGKTILETFRAIDGSRFDLHLGVFETRHESGRTPLVEAAEDTGMTVHHIRAFNQYDPRLIWRVARLVRRLKAHIVHAHEPKSDVLGYLAAKLAGVPVMTTAHGWIGNRLKDRVLGALDRQLLRAFDRVIAVSTPIRDALSGAGVDEKRLRLLHNAIVVGRYQRTGQTHFLEQLLGRSLDRPVVVTIGRLSPEKGHADLVEALALLRQRGCCVTAVLVGDGPARAALEEKVRAARLSDRVHFPGYVTNTAQILESSDLMVLPSHTEGLPNVALEALLMEVPVVATRVGGTPEIVIDGVTGQLVEPRAPAALAGAIAAFVAHPEPLREMARAGRRRVEAEFDFRVRTRRLEAIYLELVKGTR